ncbi:diguanylate cyclase [Paenibacillus sp. J5C_2022]|uniref:sensor domain-containing diguanylate cyclase n=1 Tax=Paenibacillus sp. J5C2022 TaxID=2977129 RepID=UPI0021CF2708|nr:diguanylate cyclase [Paenibacillus sp. J5C2022]MCU6708982.1 diguanylate cyclase [Paenibacillus sp. J5C2022]
MMERENHIADCDLWFSTADITDADEPYLASLLTESLELWSDEAEIHPFLQSAQIRFYGKEGDLLCKAGAVPPAGTERDAEQAAELAAQAGMQSVNPVRSEFGSLLAIGIPLKRRSERSVFANIVFIMELSEARSEAELQAYALHYRSCFYRAFEGMFVKDMMYQQRMRSKEAEHRDKLFLAVKRLYNEIEATSVLTEMLHSLEKLYPGSEAHLYLSQDYVDGDDRVRPLLFKNTAHDIVAQAFLEGKLTKETERDGKIRLAVPLAGKQAAYGVLCMCVRSGEWDESELPAFLLLADTAGSAFENAKLYEQSNLLINELRLINEMTKRLNQSLQLTEIFKFATGELLSIFEADYCCVLQLNDSKEFIVKSSNIPTMTSEKFTPDYGFCGIVYRTREPLIISDYWNSRVVTSRLMDNTGSRSLIAAPIIVKNEVVGVILVTHKLPNFFSYDNYKLLQVMSTHIGLAVTNASLHAEMRRLVITDNLTGLHARHYLNEQIQRRQRKDDFGSLVLVDIDFFKQVNDTFGHQIGDRILVQVSNVIHSSIRAGDIAARWGGEELAVYLPGVRAEQALRIAERIRTHVALETDPQVTVSCGVAEWSTENEKISVESLFYCADMALYEAKNKGRNCIIVGGTA